MSYNQYIFLIPIIAGIGIAGVSVHSLTILNEGIIENLNTPIDVSTLPADINHELTCFKVGLYTNWDEDWDGDFTSWLTGVDVGDHARQMFFEYDCSLTCYKHWVSDKPCLAELYPRE